MTTTRKDLYRIADALAQSKPDGEEEPCRLRQWIDDVDVIADVLNVTTGRTPNGNRSFDRDRFLVACTAKEAEE